MKVNLIYNRIPHHAGRSGYDQIARFLAGRVPVESLEADVPRMIPWKAWEWMADHSREWIAARSGMDWYDIWGLSLEIATAFKILRENEKIYHILYGENSYRYLGALSSIARWKDTRIICSYHQPPEIFDKVVSCKSMLKKLDAIIVVSSNQARYFASFVGKEKVFVIPHGVDTDFFRPGEQKALDGQLCLFVGQWLRDFDMLRDVVRCVGLSDPSVKFKIITSQEKATIFAGLSNVIALSSIADTELLQAYHEAAIMVLPLIDCTANNSLLEGLACGLPIVTTDVGGTGDYLDAACAFMVSSGDVKSMCEAILKLTSDQRLRMEMGSQSRLRAQTYDWRHVADMLIGVYQKLAS